MISSEVQRTLVKSPPELWAEISDPTSLARHLGEFGEIRITRVEPEQRVEWEAGDTSGSVVIKSSGWGTKVKLTVNRELPEPATDEAQAFTTDDDPALEAAEPEPEPKLEATESEVAAEEPVEPQAAPERRRGFFARLLGRRRAAPGEQPAVEPEPSEHVAPAEHALEPDGTEERAADSPHADRESRDDGPADGEAADISAEIKAAEEVAAEEVTAVLTGVLDRLGAAHHRPFSRA